MRPGGKSNGESPYFKTPNLSFEGRVRNVAVGVVEGDCCFSVVERFLEGSGQLEFVVEGVDGDE